MTNALVFDMPVELGLKLVSVIGSNFTDTQRKLFDDVVDEGNGVSLVVTLIDFEGSDARCIVDGGILVTLDGFVVFALESQELYVNLNLMARNLLLVPDGVDFAKPGSPWQTEPFTAVTILVMVKNVIKGRTWNKACYNLKLKLVSDWVQ